MRQGNIENLPTKSKNDDQTFHAYTSKARPSRLNRDEDTEVGG